MLPANCWKRQASNRRSCGCWANITPAEPDRGGDQSRWSCGYAAASNRLYEQNLSNTSHSELYGPYDNLGRMISFARGTLAVFCWGKTKTPDATPDPFELSIDMLGFLNQERP